MKTLMILSVLLFSSMTFASWEEDFEVLKDIPRDYQNVGNICEEMGRLQVQREFPEPQFTVEVGIAYSAGGEIMGELDLIIFDNNLQKVLRIGEVKCWENLRAGLRKAKEQRIRFVKAANSRETLIFQSTTSGRFFDAAQFSNVHEFFAMAQKGGKAVGFDEELEYSLAQTHEHRKDMMRCQSEKICAKP